MSSGVLTARDGKARKSASNRDLAGVTGFTRFTRPQSRAAGSLQNSFGRLDLGNQVQSSTNVRKPLHSSKAALIT